MGQDRIWKQESKIDDSYSGSPISGEPTVSGGGLFVLLTAARPKLQPMRPWLDDYHRFVLFVVHYDL